MKFKYNVSLEEIPGFGLGLMAHELIRKDEEYLTLPYQLLIGKDTIMKDKKVSGVFNELEKSYGEDIKFEIILYLLHQKHVEGEKSFYFPYIDILPKSYPDCPIFYSQQDLELLKGSDLYDDVIKDKERTRKQYEALKKRVFEKYPDYFPPAKIDFTEFLWELWTFSSRVFFIEGRVPREHLLPMADMINCFEPTPRDDTLQFVEDNGENLFLKADRDFKSGEQIFESYGYKSNAELFQFEGFILKDTPNRCVWMRFLFKEGAREKFGYHSGPQFCLSADAIEQRRIAGDALEYLRFLSPEPKDDRKVLEILLAEVEARIERNPYDVSAKPEHLAKRFMIFEKREFLKMKKIIEKQIKG